MPKSANQKLKLMYLADIFMERTDETHYLSMKQILEALDAYGIKAERKSIYDDIELLGQYGLNIEGEKVNGRYGYHLLEHRFELAELKLLVDAVLASRFITAKKSQGLIEKLCSLVSRYEAKQLQRQLFVTERIKTVNESVFYNIDELYAAINADSKIEFEYYEWSLKKELVLRPNGKKKDISPLALIWDDENYYLVAYDTEADKIKHYRVDKMRNITATGQKRDNKERYSDIDMALYAEKMFGMFGGDEMTVTMECTNELVGVIIDRFGKDLMLVPKADNKFTVHFKIQLSKQFLAWVFSLGDRVKIISPTEAVEAMKEEIRRLAEQYL
ncbi:MAG: WYL domain-containing protein [Lachnospiraceae bacterium]|nr:WYL domain-containing protein [Lachnospiraceae bacterium]